MEKALDEDVTKNDESPTASVVTSSIQPLIPLVSFIVLLISIFLLFRVGGLWSLLSIILLGGGIGGFAFSFDNTESHNLRLPWNGHEIDTGFLGHLLVGIGGAIIAVAAAIVTIDLNVWPIVGYSRECLNVSTLPFSLMTSEELRSTISELKQHTNLCTDLIVPHDISDEAAQKNPTIRLVQSIIFTSAISVIGGYSGLRLISGFSTALLKKLNESINDMKNESDAKFTSLNESLNKANLERIKANKVVIDLQLIQAINLADKEEYIDAIDVFDNVIEAEPTHAKAWGWKARIYRKQRKMEDSLNAISKAISLDPNNWIYHFNKACYLLDFKDNSNVEAIQLIKRAAQCIEQQPSQRARFIESLHSDSDINKISTAAEILELKNTYPQ